MERNLERGAIGQQATDGPGHTWAVLCHLSALAWWALPGVGHLLGPLVLWLVKRGDDEFVDAHGKEAVNFQISCTVYAVALMVAAVVWLFPVGMGMMGAGWGGWAPWPPRLLAFLGFGVGWLLVLGGIVAWHLLIFWAAFRASNGQAYRYPLTIRWIR
ncbi:MAG TPA: DUF4870 domain-containing protein [Thermaerobacter sp.]